MCIVLTYLISAKSLSTSGQRGIILTLILGFALKLPSFLKFNQNYIINTFAAKKFPRENDFCNDYKINIFSFNFK